MSYGDRTRNWYDRANRLLLNHITTQASKGVHYCCDKNRSGEQSASIQTRETQELIAPLICAKNAWAAEMAMVDLGEGVDPKEQHAKWDVAMLAAEPEVQLVRDRYAQVHASRRAA
jgi:hypothetical protein